MGDGGGGRGEGGDAPASLLQQLCLVYVRLFYLSFVFLRFCFVLKQVS